MDINLVLALFAGVVLLISAFSTLLREGPRGAHDVIVSSVRSTTRAEVGVVTDRGRVLRLSVLDLPNLAPTASAPSLAGGTRLVDLLELERDERPLGLEHRAAWVEAEPDGTVTRLVSRVGVDPQQDPDIAVLAMLLAA